MSSLRRARASRWLLRFWIVEAVVLIWQGLGLEGDVKWQRICAYLARHGDKRDGVCESSQCAYAGACKLATIRRTCVARPGRIE